VSQIQNVSRREFLQDMLSAGALILGAYLTPDIMLAAPPGETPADRAVFHPAVFVGIERDEMVYIVAHRSEMGNGSRTALPRVATVRFMSSPSPVRACDLSSIRLGRKRPP
jgi:isoquinoline 1-oxidoreductase subunit beta